MLSLLKLSFSIVTRVNNDRTISFFLINVCTCNRIVRLCETGYEAQNLWSPAKMDGSERLVPTCRLCEPHKKASTLFILLTMSEDADYAIEQADAGASSTIPMEAGQIKKGG